MAVAASKAVKPIGRAAQQPVEDDRSIVDSTDEAIFDAFMAEMAENEPKKETFKTKIIGRPNVTMEWDPNIGFEDYNKWMKRCTKGKGDKAEFDQRKLADIVISNCNVGIYFSGKPVRNKETGEMYTVSHSAFHALMPRDKLVHNTYTAIKWLYGEENDGEIIVTMRKIVEKGGYSLDTDDVEVDDDESPLDS